MCLVRDPPKADEVHPKINFINFKINFFNFPIDKIIHSCYNDLIHYILKRLEDTIMYRAPHECCVCGGKLSISRLTCPSCGTAIEGEFEGCPFCSLSPEETKFLLTFLKNRGSIKDVEREMGISYPTVRAALDHLLLSLGLTETPTDESPGPLPSPEPRRGDKEPDRKRRDILKKLAEHKISADEAARLLREL